jgi:membrane protease YdiL (CAAX protease family)
MIALERFATAHPVLFGCLTVLIFVLFVVAAGVLAYATAGGSGGELVAAAVKLIGALVLLLVLQRFGWLRAAGIAQPARWRPWLLALPAIVSSLIVNQAAFFRGMGFHFPDPAHAGSVALNMMVDGGLQEIAFRGVLLYALIRVWGGSKRGIVQSVIVSAALFGGLHILNVAARGRELPQTLLQIADTLLSGVYYAALVLSGGNIWPVVLWHGLLNAAASARSVGIPDFEESVSAWGLLVLCNLPLLIYGVYLLWRLRPRPVVPDAA